MFTANGFAAATGATAKIARTARDKSAIPNFFACHLNLLNLRVKVLI
jgi:hypothetical protein